DYEGATANVVYEYAPLGGQQVGEIATAPVPVPVPGFDGSTIKVGSVTDLTGPVAIIGVPLHSGLLTYFDWVNSQGGVAGQYPIEVVEGDSLYNPTVALQVYNEMKDDVAFIAELLGTPVVNAALETLADDGLMAVPATLDAAWVRQPNLMPLGAPYQVQAINGIDWWINDGGGSADQVYCTFIQDDPYGEAGQEGVDFIAAALGITIVDTARYVSGDTDFSAQVQQLQGSGCEVVWLSATPSVTGGALGAAAQSGFAPMWLGQSPVWINVLADSALAPYLETNLIIVGEGATWADPDVPGMVKMIERLEEFYPDQAPDYYFQFGYGMAQLTVQVLEQAVANGDLSREGVLQASTQIGEFDFDGLLGTYLYGPVADREPSRSNTIYRVNPAVPNGVEAAAVYQSVHAADIDF
ncbi:MAG: ABC transporter substrate-binding protein, partial [Actinobacteria bacterium]|nr:ABC transporter substrate-binding protein [Actinomycetota bacterium]